MFELDPDENTALIERAAHHYAEAQRQRTLGTVEGYETAISLSEEAGRLVDEARARAASLPEKTQAVSDLLDTVSAEALDDWRDRASRVSERLQAYSGHWTPDLASDASEAIASLYRAELDLARVSSDVRERRRLRQSELDQAIGILSNAAESMDEAGGRIRNLESEAQRIEDLHRDLREEVEELDLRTLRVLRELSEQMLPEVRRRFDDVLASFRQEVSRLDDPVDVDLDKTMTEWLPSIRSRLGEVLEEHEKSQRQYRRALKKVTGRIERKWLRLVRLRSDGREPLKEDFDRLARDVDAWRGEVEGRADNPLALRDLLDGQARALEDRIEEVYRRAVTEGGSDVPGNSAPNEWEALPLQDRQSHRRSRRILRKATARISRKWARLLRLEPSEQPRLREAFECLARDVAAWHTQASQETDHPLGLGDLTDGQASGLEARIDEMHRQAIAARKQRRRGGSSRTERRQANKLESLGIAVRETGPVPTSLATSREGDETDSDTGLDEAKMSDGLSETEVASISDDPRYRAGIACLQTGKWQEAIDRFQELLGVYPDAELARRALEEARFKAKLDSTAHVRGKRWIIPWGRLLFYFSVVVLTGLLAAFGTYMFRIRLAPVLAEVRMKRQIGQLREECADLREAGALDAAEACYQQLLSLDPQDQQALEGLQEIAQQRGLERLYQEGLQLEREGDNSSTVDREAALGYHEAALEKYTEIMRLSPLYRDVSLRITAIDQQMVLVRLFSQAEADYEAGQVTQALDEYLQVGELSNRYERDLIDSRLFAIYLHLGREIIERRPAVPEVVPDAREYFEKALRLEPRSADATLEKRLASLFLEGQDRYYQGHSDEAITRLRQVFEQRPDYLGGILVGMLYDAYIHSGDAHQAAGDIGFAYEQYRKAAALPLADKTLAVERLEGITPLLTPTPTPTPTATPTSTPLPTATPKPTPIPTPKPLVAYRGYIAFYSADEEKPGIWIMDSSGQNRQYLGRSSSLRKEYDALVEEARYSPDHRYYLFVQSTRSTAQVFVLLPKHEQYGDLPPEQLTKLSGLSYDPVWSPDGSRVAFVSQENRSDDIWVINADGSRPRNLTGNTWEWDKHPSWSPDSRRIVFWSNREGRKQIYVMEADGRDVRNISNTEGEEYDPIWIR